MAHAGSWRSRIRLLLVLLLQFVAIHEVFAQAGAAREEECVLLGAVRWESKGVLANAVVRLDDGGRTIEARADKQGRFRFEKLAAGTYKLRVGSGTSTSYAEKEVTLRTGENEIAVVVPDPANLELVVVSEDGDPIPARVVIWGLKDTTGFPWSPDLSALKKSCDAQGRVEFPELQPATTDSPVFFDSADRSGYRVIAASKGYFTETFSLEAPAGRTRRELKLRKQPPPAVVEVSVVESTSGKPVVGSRVECIYTRQKSTQRWWAESATDKKGKLSVEVEYQSLTWHEDETLDGVLSLRAVCDGYSEAKAEVPNLRSESAPVQLTIQLAR